MSVERRGVDTKFFAQSSDRQFRDVVGFHKLQRDPNKIAFAQIGPLICHDHDNSEIAGGEIRSCIPKCHFEESFCLIFDGRSSPSMLSSVMMSSLLTSVNLKGDTDVSIHGPIWTMGEGSSRRSVGGLRSFSHFNFKSRHGD